MGTRSLLCIFYKGRFVVVQYTQFDGYPEGKGVQIFEFLKNPINLVHLKEGLDNHICIPTKEEKDEIGVQVNRLNEEGRQNHRPWALTLGGALLQFWPGLSRETGAKIFKLIATAGATTSGAELTAETTPPAAAAGPVMFVNEEKRVPLYLDFEFVNDTLSLEWAYVVDLDANTFEVYKGSQSKEEAVSNRFNHIGGENETVPKLVKTFTIDGLPAMEKDFYKAIPGWST